MLDGARLADCNSVIVVAFPLLLLAEPLINYICCNYLRNVFVSILTVGRLSYENIVANQDEIGTPLLDPPF